MQRLGHSLTELDCTIQTHVSAHYNDLLSRAVSNSQLEKSLAVMATHIGNMQSKVAKLPFK